LFTKAVLMLSGNLSLNRLNIVAKGIRTICEGEVDQYQNKYNINSSVYSYIKRIGRKTAVLFSASCALGADTAKCSHDIAKCLARFGYFYGTAFQIKDDIENFINPVTGSDKPYGNDIMEGIITLPVIYALRKNQDIKRDLIEFLNKKGKASKSELDEMIRRIIDSDGIEEAEKLADKYIEKGLDMLKGLPDNRYKNILAELIIGLRL
ncbi:MAG: polyprenyl synthetase family protein, partial [Clostridiaceae bacterium]|nr:polyprenyl synthetase family protein [Clostridiaceae bacterium]